MTFVALIRHLITRSLYLNPWLRKSRIEDPLEDGFSVGFKKEIKEIRVSVTGAVSFKKRKNKQNVVLGKIEHSLRKKVQLFLGVT